MDFASKFVACKNAVAQGHVLWQDEKKNGRITGRTADKEPVTV